MLPKKGLRKITVDHVAYQWIAKYEIDFPHEDGLRITIVLNRLLSIFQRFHVEYKQEKCDDGSIWLHKLGQKNAVTNKLISQIIKAALKNGWEKAPDGVFDSKNYEHDLLKSIGSMFQIDILKSKIVEEKYFNYLDIDAWAYSPAKGYGEFYYLFYQETVTSNSKLQEQVISEYHQNEKFIIKMLTRYGKFLNIPHANLEDFLSNQKYVNEPLSDKEIETHLLKFIKSESAPTKLTKIKIESANSVFKESLSYGLIAKTKNGLLGYIWDHPG